MKQFIKKTILFLVFPFVLCLLFFFGFYYTNVKTLEFLRVNHNVTTLFLGDSHIQQAIDDKMIKNCINLAQNSESYYFTYFKLKEILKNNRNIKKIYLGYSYHNLSSYYEDYVFGEHSKDISTRYFNILPYSEKIKLLKCNAGILPVYFKNILKNDFKNSLEKNSKQQFLGYYENLFDKSTPLEGSMDFRINFQYYKEGQVDTFSVLNIHYLKLIQQLCSENKIELILLNTPLYSYYKSKIPPSFLEKFNEIINKNHFKIVNLESMELTEEDFIPDGDHVSIKGVEKIAAFFNKQL